MPGIKFKPSRPAFAVTLANPSIRPGGRIRGHVVIVSEHDMLVERAVVSLVTEVDGGVPVDFHRAIVAGPFEVLAERPCNVPFTLSVPWQVPVTHLPGQPLPGMMVGLRADLEIADGPEAGYATPLYVHPFPAQERMLDVFAQAGFRFRHVLLRSGRIPRVHQSAPFYQEIGLRPPADHLGLVTELELIFLADPDGADVILGLDRWAGQVTWERPTVARLRVTHANAERTDWTKIVDAWVRDAMRRHAVGHRMTQPPPEPPPEQYPPLRGGADAGQGASA